MRLYTKGMRDAHDEAQKRLRALFYRIMEVGPNTPTGEALGRRVVAELDALWREEDSREPGEARPNDMSSDGTPDSN